ncbi:hypothetical protein [Micromonospora sp. NPDC050276]|uniref:hypothetical protein n=1 Tax=Micromonospora sp. NPDC050276 TaxID=3364278 RepID=UPI0037AA7C1A
MAAEFSTEGDTLWLRPLGHRGLDYDEGLRAEIAALLPPAADAVVSPGQRVFHWIASGPDQRCGPA